MTRLYLAAAQLNPAIRGQSALARALSQSPQTVKNWESRPTGVSASGASKAQQELGISSTWILDGDAPMFVSTRAVAPTETPPGYLRFDLYEGAAGMGAGVANSDYPEVIRTVDVAEWEIRKKLGFLPAPGRMRLITGRGPSMRPKIEDGDVVMIDTSVTWFDGDDYYLISVDGEAQIKMLQKRVDGIYVVSSNPDFREWRIATDDLVVCGKALIGMGLRRL
ncbi:LexA family transcriptional regulator [Stenotrophomonas koreensis]|uniref:LexA family transcriptional regulator n=1 Tax=Stenotrophomonas koreensis TaxID=266128 RepID=UPI001FCD2ECF|nr:S24 family peptidase [Stenotrophomonas koreensis]